MGRRDELALLEDELSRAAAGELPFVLVLGEAGVGKSRLGRELLARRPGATRLFARAHPLGASAAFGLWTEAVAPVLESLSDEELIAACGGLLDDLASLFLRVASVRGSVPERDPPVPRLLQGLGRLLDSLSRDSPLIAVLDEILAGLNQAQPDALNAYPSALHVLSFEARAGRLRINPRRVYSAAEPLLPEIRAAAEEAWGVRVGNLWGTSEGGGTATPCDHRSSHISEDLVIVEPVDADGKPVARGERSAKVYLTNLYNHALPLIRYEITDEVTVLNDPCPCGSAHACVADIQGRLDDTFDYDGLSVHPHLFRSALGRSAAIVEYQVRQTRSGARIVARCQGPVDFDGVAHEIEAGLARLGLRRPKVTLETVDRLARDGGPAKLKRFVPLAPPSGGRAEVGRREESCPPEIAAIA